MVRQLTDLQGFNQLIYVAVMSFWSDTLCMLQRFVSADVVCVDMSNMHAL